MHMGAHSAGTQRRGVLSLGVVLHPLQTRIPSACGNLKGNIIEAPRDPSIPPCFIAPASSSAPCQGQEWRGLPAWNYFMVFCFFFPQCPSVETRYFNKGVYSIGTMAHYSLDFHSWKNLKSFFSYPGGKLQTFCCCRMGTIVTNSCFAALSTVTHKL